MRALALAILLTGCAGPPVFPARGPESISVVFAAQHELGKPYPSEDDRVYEQLTRKIVAALERDPRVHVTIVEKTDTMPASFDYLATIELDASVTSRWHCVVHSTHFGGAIWDAFAHDNHHQRDAVTCDAGVDDPPIAEASITFRISRHMERYGQHHWPKLTKQFTGPKVGTDDVQPLVVARVAEFTRWVDASVPALFAGR